MNYAEVYNGAAALMQRGLFTEALPTLEKIRDANPTFGRIHNDLGVTYLNLGRFEEAFQAFQTSAFLTPFEALAYNNLGIMMSRQERHGEALAYFSYADKLAPNSPAYLSNIGDSLIKLGQFEQAEIMLTSALRIDPTSTQAMLNLGVAYWGLGRFIDAQKQFATLQQIDPNNAFAHKNWGLLALLRGDYERGWVEYDWRFAADRIKPAFGGADLLWSGQQSGSVGVYREQGLGDQILYASMLDDMRDNEVVWEADPRLLPLLQRSFPAVKFVGSAAEVRAQAPLYNISAGSLGRYVRDRAYKFSGAPYLKADPDRVQALRECMKERGIIIGVSWASVGTQFAASKFIPLPEWQWVFASGVFCQFVDLQYQATDRDRMGAPLRTFPEIDNFNDIDGLAALISACDIVITISNVTAHLAGALGKEVWVLVPAGYGKFWYWGHEGTTTPWYASAKLFRQKTPGDWRAVMQEVSDAVLARTQGDLPQLLSVPELPPAPQSIGA